MATHAICELVLKFVALLVGVTVRQETLACVEFPTTATTHSVFSDVAIRESQGHSVQRHQSRQHSADPHSHWGGGNGLFSGVAVIIGENVFTARGCG